MPLRATAKTKSVQPAPGRPPALSIVAPSRATGLDWRAGLPTLVCENLVLREPRLADAGSLLRELSAEEVWRFMSRPPSDVASFERFILWLQSQRRLGRCFCYGVVPEGHETAVGLVQVRQLEPGFGSAEWGFALGHHHWGAGIFRVAAPAVMDFAFRHAGTYRLEARASTENGRANGALRRLGGRLEGVLRKSLLSGELPMDQLLWSMHTDDWSRLGHSALYQLREPSADDLPPAGTTTGGAAPQPWRVQLPALVAESCTLREPQFADAPELLRLTSDADVARFSPPGPSTIEGFEQFISWTHRQREAGRSVCFAVVPSGTALAAGIFQIRQLDPTFQTAEWGFVLGKPYWGRGIFGAAARLVLGFAFDTLGVQRLEARASTGNVRGNRALQKIGATREGQLRRSFLLGGVYHDDSLWAILADDWRRKSSR